MRTTVIATGRDHVEAAAAARPDGGRGAITLLLERVKKSHSNYEFLTQVHRTTPAIENG